MPEITADHPAVEAAFQAYRDHMSLDGSLINRLPERTEALRLALNAAMDCVTAEDLQDRTAGRQLLSRGWNEGLDAGQRGIYPSTDPYANPQ